MLMYKVCVYKLIEGGPEAALITLLEGYRNEDDAWAAALRLELMTDEPGIYGAGPMSLEEEVAYLDRLNVAKGNFLLVTARPETAYNYVRDISGGCTCDECLDRHQQAEGVLETARLAVQRAPVANPDIPESEESAAYKAGCGHCGKALPPGEEADHVLQEDEKYYCSSRCMREGGISMTGQYMRLAERGLCVDCGLNPNEGHPDEICEECDKMRKEVYS